MCGVLLGMVGLVVSVEVLELGESAGLVGFGRIAVSVCLCV